MYLQQAFILRIIILMVILFIVLKMMGPIVRYIVSEYFLSSKKKKKRELSLDEMIEKQKALLHKGVVGSSLTPISKDSKNITTQDSEQTEEEETNWPFLYQQELEACEDSERQEDLRKVLAVFESIQWGDTQAFSDVRKKSYKVLSVSIEKFEASKAFKEILKINLLSLRKNKNLLSYSELIDLLVCATFFNIYLLPEELESKEIKSFAHYFLLPPGGAEAMRFYLYYKYTSKEETEKSLRYILAESNDQDQSLEKFMLSRDKKFFTKSSDILKEIKEVAPIISCITPLAEKVTIETSKALFLITEKSSKEKLKKLYKKMAKERHPDRIASYRLSEEATQIANANFQILKQSYELLVEKYCEE